MTLHTHPRGVRSFVLRAGPHDRWPAARLGYTVAAIRARILRGAPATWRSCSGVSPPRVVEIGFGNGANLIHMASQRPEVDFLGIEVHRPGVGRVLLDIEHLGLRNVRVSNHDAGGSRGPAVTAEQCG